jgi:hypothetical protein
MTIVVPRFWVPFGAEISLADGGFLPDPTDEMSSFYNEGAAELSELEQVPCLMLLGEPGAGKTTALAGEYERRRDLLADADGDVLFVNLGATREETTLESRIFAAPEFTRWLDGDHRMHLFLDSLDEARLRVETVARLLMEGFRNAPLERLRVRISCRTADRHATLEEFLSTGFAEGSFEVRELAPLRRRDVRTLAEAAGVDSTRFIDSVFERDLQPLAITPLTLNLLLRIARKQGGPPSSRLEAYERGLRLLCAEPNEDRPLGGQAGGRLSTGERFSVAMRVAAALQLSGRTSVADDATSDPDAASASDLAGGRERDYTLAGSSAFEVGSEAVRETLGTGLFTDHGMERFGFAHASFSEYLTARWLSAAELDPDQVDNLLATLTDCGRQVAPQLREVAAWLVGMSPDFLERMIVTEPRIALRGDLDRASDDQRERLVAALLRGVADESSDLYGWHFRSTAAQLAHPELAKQLVRVLEDTDAEEASRMAACDVIGACELSELEGLLAKIALRESEPELVRVHAIRALDRFAADSTRRRLHTLATEPLANDPDDEIKGAALQAVWPRALSVRRMFASLRPPKRKNLLGLYKSFLWNDLVEGLEDEGLGVALRWAAATSVSHDPMDALGDAREEILVRAWDSIGEPRIARAYAEVLIPLLREHHDLLDRQRRNRYPDVLADQAGRRALVRELVKEVSDETLNPSIVAFSTPPLILVSDFDWLVERLRASIGRRNEPGWAALVSLIGMHAGRDADVLELIYSSEALRERTAARLGPVRLDSAEAESARKHRQLQQEMEREEGKERERRVDLGALVGEVMERFGRSNPRAFAEAIYLLSFEEDQRMVRWFVSDVRRLHGWTLLTPRTRSELLDAAPIYLANMEVAHRRWFLRRRINNPAWAAYRAIRMLHEMRPSEAAKLKPGVWKRWAPVIIGWPCDGRAERAFNEWTLAELSAKAPAETAKWFGLRLDRDLRANDELSGLHHFAPIWNERIEAVVLRRARRSGVDPKARAGLIEFLLQQDSQAGRALAKRLASATAIRARGRRRLLALTVADVMARNSPTAEWAHLWPLIQRFPSFGRDLIGDLAYGRRGAIAPLVSVAEAVNLFEYTEKQFPAAEDPPMPDGVGAVTLRDEVARWRDDILRVISAVGTPESVAALEEIAARHPERPGLLRFAREASESLLTASWNPPTPADVVRLSADRARRWVRSDRELRNVVFASLARAEAKLQGQTPAAELLWNTDPLTPKRENALCNWLKGFLEHDLRDRGILVGREPEIRPGPGSRMGESVDLEIRAVAGERVEGAPVVTVIVEVKGCWHRHVRTAMETQLADRYLDASTRQGIYLVGWYAAEEWAAADSRQTRCASETRAELQERFEEQAAQLSEGRDIELSAFVLDCSLAPRAGSSRRS